MANMLQESDPQVQAIIKDLTGKQALWVLAMASDPSMAFTEAARQAGYAGNDKDLSRIGWENSVKPNLIEAVQALRALTGKKYALTKERVLEDLASAIEMARAKKDTASVLRGLELQGKYLAMWTEKSLIEDVNETKRLTEEQEQEARRIATLRLRETG